MKRVLLIIVSVILSFAFAPIECWVADGVTTSLQAAPAKQTAAQKKAAQKKKEAQKKAAQKQKEAQKKAAQKKKEAQKNAAQKQQEAQKKATQKQKESQKNAAQKQKEAQRKAASASKANAAAGSSMTAAQEAAAYQAKVAEVERHNKRVAAYQTRDIDHRLGFWGQVGYSAIFPSAFNVFEPAAVGGVGGGAGFGYQLRYKQFLMTTGVEFQSYNSLTNLNNIPLQSYGVQEYATMQYHYKFDDMQDKWSTGYVQIPLLFGMELPMWYWQAGAKVGLNIYAKSSVSTTLTTSVSDNELVDDLVNMQNHQLGVSFYDMEETGKPISLNFNPNVALAAEVGIKLDKWLQPTVKRGRRMTPMQKFASNMHYQLALFAEYGVMNIYNPNLAEGRTNDIPADFGSVLGKPANTQLAYTSSLETSSAAGAKLNPFLVGVKLAMMCDLPRKEMRMLPMPVEPKPRMVTKVINAETGVGIANVQMTVENTNTGEVAYKTANSKGVMLSRFSKATYRVAASKLGFLPCDTIVWSHMEDLGDTIRFALVPEPKPIIHTLCGYVRDGETAQLLSADVQVAAAQEAGLSYQGATNEEGLFVSDMLAGNYSVRISSVGYLPLDTMVQFEKDTLQFLLTPIKEGIKVKIDHLYFATNKTIILPESETALDNLAKFLLENPSVSICIIGHTDNVGSDAANMRLSLGRSEAVRRDLIMRGVDANRLGATGKGETMPVATNDTEEGRAQNRRVEFEITDTQGNDIQQIYE